MHIINQFTLELFTLWFDRFDIIGRLSCGAMVGRCFNVRLSFRLHSRCIATVFIQDVQFSFEIFMHQRYIFIQDVQSCFLRTLIEFHSSKYLLS